MPRKSSTSRSTKSSKPSKTFSQNTPPIIKQETSAIQQQPVKKNVAQPQAPTTHSKPVYKSAPSSAKRKYLDTESWVDKNLDELMDIFNLGLLDLTKDEAKAITVKLVEVLRGESATIDKDTIRRRFTRYAQYANQIIAQSVLELREELTPTQLEFVVNNIGEAILGYAPRLYREIIKRNLANLLDVLKVTWRTQWIQRKYPIAPVECPHCGFSALMPDLGCIVCGSSITEEELKKHIGFDKLLEDFVKQYGDEDVKKTITYGYVYLNSLGLKPPTAERDKLDIEILLTNKEKEYIKMLLANKG